MDYFYEILGKAIFFQFYMVEIKIGISNITLKKWLR